MGKVMEAAKEKYIAPYMMVDVTSKENGIVSFYLHVGHSCPLHMEMKDERFKTWLHDKRFRAV